MWMGALLGAGQEEAQQGTDECDRDGEGGLFRGHAAGRGGWS